MSRQIDLSHVGDPFKPRTAEQISERLEVLAADPGHKWMCVGDFAEHMDVTVKTARSWVRQGALSFPVDTTTDRILVGVPYQKPPQPKPEPARLTTRIVESWHGVYFLESAGFIKIGLAFDVHVRVNQIQQSIPFDVTPIGFIPVDHREAAFEVERLWHAVFADWRHRGEWFRDDPLLREAIARLARPWTQRRIGRRAA